MMERLEHRGFSFEKLHCLPVLEQIEVKELGHGRRTALQVTDKERDARASPAKLLLDPVSVRQQVPCGHVLSRASRNGSKEVPARQRNGRGVCRV
jgi:hypothetical protein